MFSVVSFGQTRTFEDNPRVLLGLRQDRSPSLTFADVDNDGDQDVMVANGRHWPQQNEIFLNNGNGRFMIGYHFGPIFDTSYAIPAGDLDGDGDLDAIVANDLAPNMIYINDGGHFTHTGNLGVEEESTRDVVIADLNGDDLLDAVVTIGECKTGSTTVGEMGSSAKRLASAKPMIRLFR